MNRESLDKCCERGILGLVLAILIYTPLAFGACPQVPVGSKLDLILVNPFVVVLALVPVILALWAVRLWIAARPQLLWPPICWAVVAFAVYAIIRYFTADIEYVARQEMIQVLTCAFLFLVIVNNLHRQESARIIALTLVFLAMAISFYALYQFAMKSNRVWCLISPYGHRGTGTFISPNNLAGYLEMILPLGLAYTLTSRIKTLIKVFTGYASLVIFGGIIATVSRGSWAATAAALAIFFLVLLFHRTYRLPALALLAATIFIGIYFAQHDIFLKTRLSEIKAAGGHQDYNGRIGIWDAAWRLWQENMLWGVGPGHFDYRFGKYRPELVQASPDRAHNDYLNTLTDWGIVGTVLVAVAWGLLYVGVFKTWWVVRRSDNTLGDQRSNKLALILGASVGLFAILIHSAADFNMHIPANAILAVTLMALLSGFQRFASDGYWVRARLGLKGLLTTVLTAGFAYFTWQTIRSADQALWLIRAQKAAPASPEKIAALEKAFSVEPRNSETAKAIGEAFRLQSWQDDDDYEKQALEAMKWFQRATELNRYDDSSVLRYGMCLDQLERHDEALGYFERAVKMDPNSYFNDAYMGWHYVRSGDYAAARPWFVRSRRLEWEDNPVADSYLKIVSEQMAEAASNTNRLRVP